MCGCSVWIHTNLFLSSSVPLGDRFKRVCFPWVERVVFGLSVERVEDGEVACKRYDTIHVVVLWGVEPTSGRRHNPLRNELTMGHRCVCCVCCVWSQQSLCACTSPLCFWRLWPSSCTPSSFLLPPCPSFLSSPSLSAQQRGEKEGQTRLRQQKCFPPIGAAHMRCTRVRGGGAGQLSF